MVEGSLAKVDNVKLWPRPVLGFGLSRNVGTSNGEKKNANCAVRNIKVIFRTKSQNKEIGDYLISSDDYNKKSSHIC